MDFIMVRDRQTAKKPSSPANRSFTAFVYAQFVTGHQTCQFKISQPGCFVNMLLKKVKYVEKLYKFHINPSILTADWTKPCFLRLISV